MTGTTVAAPAVAAVALLLGASAPMRPRGSRRPLPHPAAGASTPRPSGAGSVRGGGSIAGTAVAVAVAIAGLVAPPLAAVPPLVRWVRRRTRHQRQHRQALRHIETILPDTVDLLLLCTGAGWSLPIAQPIVARRSPAPLGEALAAAARAADRGQLRADALLGALAPLGDRARALGQVLADHLRYGVPLAPALDRLGLELRLERRRAAEQEARKVPVRLLAPLVLCVLPAFALLSVVPLLAASLRSLPT